MKIAVLSGKGGTGKTFVSVNLSACANSATYLDCDVEEPNGHLFLQPENVVAKEVYKLLPEFDEEKCIGCKKCVEFCYFNALAYIKNKPKVFGEVCHSCGGCKIICPSGAIEEVGKPVGKVEIGKHNNVTVVSGIMNLGEASGVPVIKDVLKNVGGKDELTIIDCPPGSACTVMESVEDADYCILVSEPTVFGAHNLAMVYELVTLLGKPCGVVINKYEDERNPIDDYCKDKGIKVLSKIPYSEKIADSNANGKIAIELDNGMKEIFSTLLRDVQSGVER